MKRIGISLLVLGFCTVVSQSAMAQSHLGLRAVGFQVGMVEPEHVSGTPGFGGVADLGNLSPHVRLTSHLDFWSKSEDQPFGVTATLRDVTLGMKARYEFPVSNPRLQPYAGAGLGVHFIRGTVDVPAQDLGGGVIVPAMTIEDSSTKLGLDLGGGVEAPTGPRSHMFGEMWYGIVDQVNQFSLRVGMSFKVGA